MWPYLFSSRCGRILLESYHMPDSVIGTAWVLWRDSTVEHVGGLCRYSDRKSCLRIGAFNLIHTTCIRYISCICIYLGNFVFVLGCVFILLLDYFYVSIFIWCFFLFLISPDRLPKWAMLFLIRQSQIQNNPIMHCSNWNNLLFVCWYLASN